MRASTLLVGVLPILAVLSMASCDGGSGSGAEGRSGLDSCGEGASFDARAGTCFVSSGGTFNSDVNGDSFSDLIIGAPYADVGGVVDAGAVYVFFGGQEFAGKPPVVLTQITEGSLGGDRRAEAGDRFGWVVTAVDVDCSGYPDILVGVPFEDLGTRTDAGAFQVFFGTNTGIVNQSPVVPEVPNFWTQDLGEVADAAEASDRFGFSFAWGNLLASNEGRAEVAVGAPGEALNRANNAGAVHLFRNDCMDPPDGIRGLSSGPSNIFLNQALAGTQETIEAGDEFGWSLAAAATGTSGGSYLAIGAPGEDLGSLQDAGAMHVVSFGSSLSWQLWTQNSNGIDDFAEANDRFGEVLVTRTTPQSLSDLFVGVPREDLIENKILMQDAGLVHWIRKSSVGLTATGSRLFTQATASGSPPTEQIESGDMFGATITGGRFGSGLASIVISAPFEDFGAIANAGVVHLLKSASGVDPFPIQNTRTIGIADTPGQIAESGDLFGLGLSAWKFNTLEGTDTAADLVIGVPGKDVSFTSSKKTANAGIALFYPGGQTTSSELEPNTAKSLSATDLGITPVADDGLGTTMY